MKKYIYIFLTATFFVACSQKEDPVYEQSYVERTNATITEYSKILEEASNGWLLTLYPGLEQHYGGYNFIVSFAEGKITAVSEVNTTEATSDYSLIFNEKVILSFDTFNQVLHHFVEPSYLFPHGKEGDNQFEIQSYENEVFTLKGKRSYNTMTLSKFTGDKATFLSKMQARSQQMKSVGITPITLNGKQISLVLHPTLRQLTISEGDTSYQEAFIYTDNGIKLYEPIEIEGTTFSEFHISEDNQTLSTADGTLSTALVYTLPFDFNTRYLTLNLSADNCSANSKFSELYEQYRNFTYNRASYTTQPRISFGYRNETGVTFSLYQGGTARYTLDFLPVAGQANQVNVVEGMRSLNWNAASNLYPIIDAFVQNAPYEVTDINGDGSQYRLTSVKDDTITFLTTPQTATLPYDFTTLRSNLRFAENYASQTLIDAYTAVQTYTRTVSGSTVTDTLGNTIYFGLNRNNIGFHFYLTRTGRTGQINAIRNIELLPVPCDASQMNMIDKGTLSANTNWTTFSYLAPLVNIFTQNAPYTMYDDGSGYVLWTSVKNSEIWFYTY
ncbi:MAG: DUF4302 domain-containing protein [Capnocytophaga sp.]|nr:DUF4302 domain-containing protein [Capnocytophaga sp.]